MLKKYFTPLSSRPLRHFFKSLTLLPLTLGLFAIGQAQAKTIPIAVGVDPTFVAFFVAKENRLFEKNGLDVNLLSFGPGGSMVDGLVAGQAVISASTETTNLVRMGRSPDVVAIGVVGESGDNLKLVANKTISSPNEIKVMGVVPGGVFEYLNHLTFIQYNIDPSTVKIVQSGPPELPALLARGDIDAFWIFEPFATLAQRHGAHLLNHSKDVGYAYNFWVLASNAWLQTHPTDAHKILDSLDEACKLINQDPQAAAKAVHAQVRIPIAQTLEFLTETQCRVRAFTETDLANYEAISEFLLNKNITPSLVPVREQILTNFITEK